MTARVNPDRPANPQSRTIAQEPLVLPTVTAPQPVAPAAPQRMTMPPKPAGALGPTRADLPPESGFTLLVDGHYKSRFDSLKLAKDAAGDLKGRFPMLRVEIYDAAKKTRIAI